MVNIIIILHILSTIFIDIINRRDWTLREDVLSSKLVYK